MNVNDIEYIVAHCSATPPSAECGFKEIDAMHKARGWRGCGYHLIIRRDGSIEQGRPLDEQGAHVHGYNAKAWGVCMEGGVDESNTPADNFTDKQYAALELVVRGLLNKAPGAIFVGHRDLSPDLDGDGVIKPHEWLKHCPCFDAGEWWMGVQNA